ncbi:hypothetical protein B0A49_06177, partial [Cryomyces minteri]
MIDIPRVQSVYAFTKGQPPAPVNIVRGSELHRRALQRRRGRSKSSLKPNLRTHMENKEESRHSSDPEGDTFEDAEDNTPRRPSSASSTRSVNGRRPSSSPKRSKSPDPPPVPTIPSKHDPESPRKGLRDEMIPTVPGTHGLEDAKDNKLDHDEGQEHEAVEIATAKALSITPSGIHAKGTDETHSEEEVSRKEEVGNPLVVPSRSLAASTADHGTEKTSTHSRSSTLGSMSALPPKVPPRNLSASTNQGFSGLLPTVDFPPPPQALSDKPAKANASPAPPRKLTGPFSWLSRNTSAADKKVTSPPLPPTSQTMNRRNTASSLGTIGNNPELMLSKIEDGSEPDGPGQRWSSRSTLRDRFKYLRMREEAGIQSLDEESVQNGGALAGLIGRTASVSIGIGSPTSLANEAEGGLAVPPMDKARSNSTPGPIKSPMFKPDLPPGTASGMAAGPATEGVTSVDWDLWQSVVYEGPAAVARTSADELGRSIASGIPQAIRGVVWQVLAQSKNEELEGV